MESREICGFPASIGIWIYLMIRLQRQIGNSRSFTNKVTFMILFTLGIANIDTLITISTGSLLWLMSWSVSMSPCSSLEGRTLP